MSILIHGVPPPPFVRKTRVFLAEKGIPFEIKAQTPFGQPPEYFEISPLGKVPCLQDGDFTLPDSSAICAYLERKQPEPALYPANDEEYGRALWYEEYADTKLAETVGPVFFQNIVRPKFFKQETDPAIVKEALEEKAPPVFDYLEKEVPEDDAIVGDHFSIADIALGTMFAQLKISDGAVDSARWPKLAAYVERIHARPSFKACLEQDQQILAAI